MSYYPGQQGHSGQYPTDEYSAPSTPRDPTFNPQWDQQQTPQHAQDSSQSHQPLEQQQQHHQPLSFPPPPQQPLYLEDAQHSVPSQIPRGAHDLTPIRLLPVVGPPPGRSPPVEIKPVMLDTTVRTTAHAGPSTRPARQYHPYPRPSSPSGSRREMEAHHHVRFPSQTNPPQAHPGSAITSPAQGTQTFASPMSDYGPPIGQQASPSFVSGSPLAAPPEGAFAQFLPLGPPQEVRPADDRRYIIRADTHYDPGTRILTALLELPGMKKHDLSITLATTLFNRVRQVTINGQSRAPFAPAVTALRERKYGRFTRAFPVPADTRVRTSPAFPLSLTRLFRMPTCPSPLLAWRH
ncbi:hypothetical protein DFH09DRAFT_1164813 [Mycena vulgaris]|nr:hypothetical protein DFH09DRAFT_1164813 [Mycena vulgaris]